MNNLIRPRNGAVIAGVCAAIGNRFGVSANIVRLIAVISIVFVGAPVIIYPILWVLIPKEA
jgi:phage shock protein PspC (stress-responsive transcriptional regulator)